jgi:hypothetical protein
MKEHHEDPLGGVGDQRDEQCGTHRAVARDGAQAL